jgi:site-specific DNA-methyltransferase (adenine-specific)
LRTVWEIRPPAHAEKHFGKHPTQKPVELLKRIILASTKEGDLVLDPFCGSSTTGVACVSLGRGYIGIDLEEKYLDLSIKRFEEIVNQSNLFDSKLKSANYGSGIPSINMARPE